MRIFIKEYDNVIDNNIYISNKENSHHILNVMRKKKDDIIEVVDTINNNIYTTKILNIDPLELNIVLTKSLNKVNKKISNTISNIDLNIVLYQAIAKKDRLEYLIEKGTELGIKKFKFVEFARNVVKLNDDKKKENKILRWTKIAESASKQSKQIFIPEISIVENIIQDIVISKQNSENNNQEMYTLVLYENEQDTILKEEISKILLESIKIKDVESKTININIIVGPEGGITEEEICKFKDIGAKIITLGNNIFRTETAGLVLATIIKYECGEFNYVKEEN